MSADPVNKPRPLARAAVAAGVALWLAAAGAGAQFTQYSLPGSLAESRTPTREVLEDGYSEARWKLGRLRIDPGFALTDVGYHNNVFAGAEGMTISDFTATLSAGLNAYLHLGPKTILAGFARPQYVWWEELERLRELTESYGIGAFGYFNRMTVSLQARSDERQRHLNSEVETPVVIRNQGATLDLEVELGGRLGAFGRLSAARIRHAADLGDALPGLRLALLDRDETVAAAGLTYELEENLEIGLGLERSDVDFLRDPGARSNSGTSPLLRIAFLGNRVDAEGTLVSRDLEFEGGDRRFDQVTGTLRVELRLAPRSALTGYGGRSLVYSAFDERGTFLQQRYGLSLTRRLRERGRASIFAELGRDEFETAAAGVPRDDDFESFGANFQYPLTERVHLELGASEVSYDSSIDEFDRETTVLRTAVRVGGELFGW